MVDKVYVDGSKGWRVSELVSLVQGAVSSTDKRIYIENIIHTYIALRTIIYTHLSWLRARKPLQGSLKKASHRLALKCMSLSRRVEGTIWMRCSYGIRGKGGWW